MEQQSDKMSTILKDPSAFYDAPKDVMKDDDFGTEEKDRILQCWEEDEIAKQRAVSENMAPPQSVGATGDTLSVISQLRGELG